MSDARDPADFIAAIAQQLLDDVARAFMTFAAQIEQLRAQYPASQAAFSLPAQAAGGADSTGGLDVSPRTPEGPGAPAANSHPAAATVPPPTFSPPSRKVIVADEETIRRWAGERGLIMHSFDLAAVNAIAERLGLPRWALERGR